MKKFVIFGASGAGKNALQFLKDTDPDVQMLGFIDNASAKWGSFFEGYPIYAPNELTELPIDGIVVASIHFKEIISQLRSFRLDHIEIFLYYGFVDNEDRKQYKLLPIYNLYLFEDQQYSESVANNIAHNFSLNYIASDTSLSEPHVSVKENKRKKILFVSYFFPPIGGSGVQRSLYFVRHLSELGYEPIVLTTENDHRCVQDPSLLDELPPDISVIRIPMPCFMAEMLSHEEEHEIFNLYCGLVQSEEWVTNYKDYLAKNGNVLIPGDKMIWVNECLKRIEGIIRLEEIDIVFTTGSPCSAYLLGYYLKRKYGMKWVMDYRDPWCTNDYYWFDFLGRDQETLQLERVLENRLIDESDAIITDAESEVFQYYRTYGKAIPPIITIMNGYEESNFENIEISEKKNARFTMCFNGKMAATRNPSTILDAVNELIEEHIIQENEILWNINGTITKELLVQIEKTDKYGIISNNGYLEHHSSIINAMESDLLILLGSEGDEMQSGFSGKFFEYLRMGIPILALSTVGGECESILKVTDTGENFSYSDHEGIKNCILKHYKAWKNGETIYQGKWEEIQKHSRENRTRQLAAVFEQVLSGN